MFYPKKVNSSDKLKLYPRRVILTASVFKLIVEKQNIGIRFGFLIGLIGIRTEEDAF
jgi:hypothetical protein